MCLDFGVFCCVSKILIADWLSSNMVMLYCVWESKNFKKDLIQIISLTANVNWTYSASAEESDGSPFNFFELHQSSAGPL